MPESHESRPVAATRSTAGPSGLRVRVVAAADAILKAGRRPTIEAIRQHLGAGSQTTLMAYLNDWYGELAERLAAAETPLAGMPGEASQLLQQLWRVASKAGRSSALESDGKVDVAQRMLEAERDGLAAQNKALETLNDELKSQRRNIERLLTDTRALLNRREAELGEERASRAEAEQNLARAMLDIEVLRARQPSRVPTRRPSPIAQSFKTERRRKVTRHKSTRKLLAAARRVRRNRVRGHKARPARPARPRAVRRKAIRLPGRRR
jgi:uncharacterized coiled-coil protein SlyX